MWDFLSEKKVPTKETSVKNETKVNSVSFFDYNMISLGDTADCKAAPTATVVVAGWVDKATTVIQVVRVST